MSIGIDAICHYLQIFRVMKHDVRDKRDMAGTHEVSVLLQKRNIHKMQISCLHIMAIKQLMGQLEPFTKPIITEFI